MNAPPAVSIIMPVYDVASYLQQCLDSVRAQTFANWECICVDDGSTDGSPDILDKYAAKDPRFRIIRRKHTNAGVCRNAGLALARGEFLSFLDSDDVFAPIMLESLLSAINTQQAEIAVCGMKQFHDGHSVPRLASRISERDVCGYSDPVRTVNIFDCWVGRVWDKLFRRDLILRNGLSFQEQRTANDTRFVYCALAMARKVAVVDAPLVAYRISGRSLERTRSKSPDCLGEAIVSLYDHLRDRGLFRNGSMLEKQLKEWAATVLFWNMDSIDTANGCEQSYVLFSKICRLLSLQDVLPDIGEKDPECAACLSMVCEGASPFEYLWSRNSRIMGELRSLRRPGLPRRAFRKILAIVSRRCGRLPPHGRIQND